MLGHSIASQHFMEPEGSLPNSQQLLRIEGCRVVSATDRHGRILGFLDRSSYFLFLPSSKLSHSTNIRCGITVCKYMHCIYIYTHNAGCTQPREYN
jgi:hypothetical protein